MGNGQSLRLLEQTGLQYICLERIRLDETLLDKPALFFNPRGLAKRVPAEKFFPGLIAPTRVSAEGCYDAHNNVILPDQIFEVQGLKAVESFQNTWLPLPYCGTLHKGGVHEIDCNDWVRLFYTKSTEGSTYGLECDFVICVDTQASPQVPNSDFCPFLSRYLNRPVVLSPLSAAFWNSGPLKAWISRLGTTIHPDSAHDVYPAFSHYLALLKVLKSILPSIEICEAIGEPMDVHLFLDVGNSRTCGIMVEHRPGSPLQPETGFEKLEIRSPSTPTRVWSEPFGTHCKFMPSPFDNDYYKSVWTPNFRFPSLLRIGNAARHESLQTDTSAEMFGRCTLSSPKRYLWSEARNPSPWYFATNAIDGSIPLIKGDILAEIAEDGSPRWLTKAPMPIEPCYPHGSVMTFFILEVLSQAFSFMNSASYRSKKRDPLCKRILKTLVVTTPNGMVPAERKLYLRRVAHAVDLFWKFYGLPEDRKPSVVLRYDEATCAQLVYLHSIIKNRLKGRTELLFDTLGRERPSPQRQRSGKSIRIASIDIGGGTSDLMITEYRDLAGGAVTQLEAKSLFQEGVSIAGDDVVRNIIRDILMPGFVKWADSWYGSGEITLEHLQTFFGLPHYVNAPGFVEMKKKLMELVWIPMAFKFLNHAESKDGPDVVSMNYIDFEFYPTPDAQLKEFFSKTLNEIVGSGTGVYPTLDETVWEMDRRAINDVIYNTLYQMLRIFSEVIVKYNCDLVLIAGKMSALPEVRDILVDFCPAPPHRIVSLTKFNAGRWYPFDLERECIKDAKTTVAVGAALWFFAEELRALPMFGLRTDREMLEKGNLFIGQVSERLVRNKDLLFPKGARNLSLVGTTYLGARRVDCEDSHANMLYEINYGGSGTYATPISVSLRQDPRDKSDLTVIQAVDAKGRTLSNLKVALRTLEEDLYWLDQGAVW